MVVWPCHPALMPDRAQAPELGTARLRRGAGAAELVGGDELAALDREVDRLQGLQGVTCLGPGVVTQGHGLSPGGVVAVEVEVWPDPLGGLQQQEPGAFPALFRRALD